MPILIIYGETLFIELKIELVKLDVLHHVDGSPELLRCESRVNVV